MYCKYCNKKLSDTAVVCPYCGYLFKNILIALLLCSFIGSLGAHRFYVGKKRSAIAMLILTFSIFGAIISTVWTLVDFVIILCGCFRDKNGHKLSC